MPSSSCAVLGDVTPDDIRSTMRGHEALFAYRPEGGGTGVASDMRGVMTTIWSLNAVNHARKVVRREEEGMNWVIETIGESAPKYRQLRLSGLAELRDTAKGSPSSPPSGASF